MRGCALALGLMLSASTLAYSADGVTVTAKDESGGQRIQFHWPDGAEGKASISGRTLTATFSKPLDIDLVRLADIMRGTGSFVRLSSDHKTLSVTLLKEMSVAAENAGGDVVLHLTPGAAPAESHAQAPPKDQAAAKSETPAKEASAPATAPAPALESDPAPTIAQVKEPELTVSQGEDYTRLRFEFPLQTEYTAALAEGELSLTFKSDSPVRLSVLRVNPPARVRSATGAQANGVFSAKIGVVPGVSLRQAQEGSSVIIDLVDPKAPEAAEATHSETTDEKPSAENAEHDAHAHKGAEEVAEAHGAESGKLDEHAQAATPEGEHPAPDAKSAAPPEAQPEAHGAAGHDAAPASAQAHAGDAPAQGQTGSTGAPGTIGSVLNIKDIDVSALDERVNNPHADDPYAEANPHDESALDAPPAETLQPVEEPPAQFPLVITLGKDAVRLAFNWGKPVPAAVVRRGERLWIAFGARGDIDLSALDALRDKGVQTYGSLSSEGATIVGLQLDERLLATVTPDETSWTIALGDSILTTAPDIALEPRTDEEEAALAAKIDGDLSVVHFRDTDIDDELILVLSGPKAQGLVGTRRFVDFEVLASAQGLALRKISDRVDVHTEPGYAVISRPGGLALSGTHMPGDPVANVPKPKPEPVKTNPVEMKLTEWRGPAEVPFDDGYKQRLIKIAMSDKEDHLQAQIDLVRYLLGNEMPHEALGLLGMMAAETPTIASDLHYRALRGVANLMAGRLGEAANDLDDRLMPNDPNAELWLGLLEVGKGEWSKARVRFGKAGSAIDRLDNPWRARARLAAAEAALGVNDVTNARMNLEFLQREGLSAEEIAKTRFLDARLAEMLSENEKAMTAYEKLAKGSVEPIAVRAELARTRLAAKLGKITVDEAIDRMEALRFQWRGDAIEADTLLELGKLYARLGDYRHALSTMKTAVIHFPGTPLEREITGEMYAMFEDLYLAGKADEMQPIQALGLYYDFKELTPVGPKGDVMIRRLSDRLVAMDLLDQATELLSYQVDNRLRGVARSQVATRLALVQLMNHRAEDALRTINGTRQSRLPDTIATQRRLIEARALMDLKRYDSALDVVDADSGPSIDRLRADIYWHQDDWGKTGPALEQGLGDAWSNAAPLNEGQRFDVMRASIAYVLGGDKDGLARMAERFTSKMVKTPDEHAFKVVISDPGNANLELHSLAEKIASIDTLSAFLDDLKKSEPPEPPVASADTPTN